MKVRFHENLDLTDTILQQYFPLKSHNEHLGIKVGSIKLQARMSGSFLSVLNLRYKDFLCKDTDYDFTVEAVQAKDLDLSAYPNVTVKSLPGGFTHYVFRWDFIARIDLEKKYASLLIAPVGSPLCIDSIFRIAVSFIALNNDGFLLHSAAIASKNEAFLFCGVSGSGKSTITNISQGFKEVLTDEMSLVEKSDGRYYIWGTPFWGQLQLSVNRSVPLRAIFILAKAKHNCVEKIGRTEGLTEFMKTVLFFGQNLEMSKTIMDEAIEFLDKVPLRKLFFLPEKSLWGVIDDYYG